MKRLFFALCFALLISSPAHADDPAGVLLSGELTVITEDDKKLLLKAGDPIVEVVNKRHYGKNTGKGPAEIIVFYAGSPATPITVKE